MSQGYNVEKIRQDFPILSREVYGKPLVYLDNAASTLKPIQVIDRLSDYYEFESSNVHRGAHFLSSEGTVAFERARDLTRDFLKAKDSAEIIFTRGTTESINLVAQTYGRKFFQAGDEIILSELEHHSNIVPWQMIAEERGCLIKVIHVTDSGEIDFNHFQQLLSAKTKMVALSWCSNTLGTITPIEKFIAAAHQAGAKILIDAAQAVSHLPVDVQKLDCDFLAFSGHKIFAPYGIGVLYGKAELLDMMPPYQGGGSMIRDVTFTKTTYLGSPQKFEAGTPAIADALGLAAALEYLQVIGMEESAAHEQDLLHYATAQLKTIPGLRIIGEAPHKTSIISFVIAGAHPSDIGSLIDREGVAIRTGHHCTQPLMKRFGITATARASFSIYNTRQEIDILVKSLLKAKEFF